MENMKRNVGIRELGLPREYSNRSVDKTIHYIYPSTTADSLLKIINSGGLIRQAEDMVNKQKVAFADYVYKEIGHKFKNVFGGDVKTVKEYSRLCLDSDYDTAAYLVLNDRFRHRVNPYLLLGLLIAGRSDCKGIAGVFLGYCKVRSSGGVSGVSGYDKPVTKTAIQHLIDSNSVTVIKAEIEGEDEPRFLGTPAEWEWLLSKKFKAYSR